MFLGQSVANLLSLVLEFIKLLKKNLSRHNRNQHGLEQFFYQQQQALFIYFYK